MVVMLEVKPRSAEESVDMVRGAGRVPAVFYGPKETAKAISVDAGKLEVIWRDAGETTLITLSGVGEAKDTLIHDIQVHPLTGQILHADFYVIEKGKKVEINVPLHFVGVAPAEKAGHIIVKALHEVAIEVAPAELPHSFEIDLSVLENVGDHILAKDIKLPASAELKIEADEIVASVTEFHEEKEQAPAAAAEAAAPAEGEAAPAAAEGEKSE